MDKFRTLYTLVFLFVIYCLAIVVPLRIVFIMICLLIFAVFNISLKWQMNELQDIHIIRDVILEIKMPS